MEPLCALLQPGFHVSAVQREVVWCITNVASSALTEAETQLLLAAAPLLIMHLENTADVEIQAAVDALDGGADDEVLAGGLGSHYWDWRGGGFAGGEGLEVQVEDGGLDAAELLWDCKY